MITVIRLLLFIWPMVIWLIDEAVLEKYDLIDSFLILIWEN